MYKSLHSFGTTVIGEGESVMSAREKRRAEMDAALAAAKASAGQAQASGGAQQSSANEAAFLAEVARAAAFVEVINKWAEQGSKVGSYPSSSAADGFKELSPSVREAFLGFIGPAELALLTDSKKATTLSAGSKLPTVVGVSDKASSFKFKPNDLIASGYAFLVLEKYLGSPDKIGVMYTLDPQALAAASKEYVIVAAPQGLRAQAAARIADQKKQQDALKKWNELWSMQVNTTAAKVNQVGGVVVGTAAIYHGYKRNDSLGWALVWGILGAAFWPITAPVMLAQGFGKPKLK